MSASVGEAQFAELLPLLTHAQVLMVLRGVLSVLRGTVSTSAVRHAQALAH